MIENCQIRVESFSYDKVYVYSWYNLERLNYKFIANIYHNFLKFNDSK